MTNLTRRSWLRGSAALALGSATALRTLAQSAEEPPFRLPFGFSLYGMKNLKTSEALSACAAIGYDGVELALLSDWPTDPKRLTAADRRALKQQLADAGLSLMGLMENLAEPGDDATHRANLDRLSAAAELGHFLSPKSPPPIETVLGGMPARWDEVKDRLVERLRSWAATAAAAKTIVAVKPHVAHALHTPEAANWLIGQVDSPWLKLNYDCSHFLLRGMPLKSTLAELLPKTAFIHVKDARGTPEKFEFLLPGEGNVDYVDYFRRIGEARFRGPVVVEVSSQISNRPAYDPVAAARSSFDRLEPALRAAGVRPA